MNHSFIAEIPQNQYSIIKQIGSGTFSDIFSATHIKTNTNVALKVSLRTNSEDYYEMITHEVEINKILHHPFICKFFTEFETEHLNVIVMELIDGMSALDYVNQFHGLPISDVSRIFTELLISIEYLHDEVHISHRDLKLENIMFDSCGHIRLIDFGFSSMKSMMSTMCGSIPYCAPEVLSGQLYTDESDIWSMGIILYALYDGKLPFFHLNTNTLASIICNQEVKFRDDFDESLKDLLIKMLNKNPQQRIKISDIKCHRFLSQEKLLQIDYKKLFTPTYNHNNSKSQSFKLAKQSSLNNTSHVRKNNFFHFQSSSNNLAVQMHEILKEKITLKTDDVDLSIENRKDFGSNLTKLIEYELVANLYASSISDAASCDVIDIKQNCINASSNQLSFQNGHLVNLPLNHYSTADHLPELNHNHHFILTNRFVDIKNRHDHSCSQSSSNNSNVHSNNSNEYSNNSNVYSNNSNVYSNNSNIISNSSSNEYSNNSNGILNSSSNEHSYSSSSGISNSPSDTEKVDQHDDQSKTIGDQSTNQQHNFYQSHALNLGMPSSLLPKYHRRHSSFRGFLPQVQIITPFVAHSKSNFREES